VSWRCCFMLWVPSRNVQGHVGPQPQRRVTSQDLSRFSKSDSPAQVKTVCTASPRICSWGAQPSWATKLRSWLTTTSMAAPMRIYRGDADELVEARAAGRRDNAAMLTTASRSRRTSVCKLLADVGMAETRV